MRSDTLIPVLFVAAFFVLLVGSILWTTYRRRRRRQQLSEAAFSLGFSFEPNGQPLLEEGLSNLPLFSLASLRRGAVVNLMRGQRGSYPVAICDCRYSTSPRGSGQSTREQTAFCFDVKGLDLPDFSLAPRDSGIERQMVSYSLALGKASASATSPVAGPSIKDLISAAMQAATDKGIEFSERPEFSSRYILWAGNRDAVKNLFLEHAVGFFVRQE